MTFARSYLIPGQGYVSETKGNAYLVPGWGYVNETVDGTAALSALSSSSAKAQNGASCASALAGATSSRSSISPKNQPLAFVQATVLGKSVARAGASFVMSLSGRASSRATGQLFDAAAFIFLVARTASAAKGRAAASLATTLSGRNTSKATAKGGIVAGIPLIAQSSSMSSSAAPPSFNIFFRAISASMGWARSLVNDPESLSPNPRRTLGRTKWRGP